MALRGKARLPTGQSYRVCITLRGKAWPDASLPIFPAGKTPRPLHPLIPHTTVAAQHKAGGSTKEFPRGAWVYERGQLGAGRGAGGGKSAGTPGYGTHRGWRHGGRGRKQGTLDGEKHPQGAPPPSPGKRATHPPIFLPWVPLPPLPLQTPSSIPDKESTGPLFYSTPRYCRYPPSPSSDGPAGWSAIFLRVPLGTALFLYRSRDSFVFAGMRAPPLGSGDTSFSPRVPMKYLTSLSGAPILQLPT